MKTSTRSLQILLFAGACLAAGQLFPSYGQPGSGDPVPSPLQTELRALGYSKSGDFLLEAAIPPTERFTLQSSSNLRQWRQLASVVGSGQPVALRDASAAQADRKFYRLTRDMGMFRFNPQHTGTSDSEGLPETNVVIKWKFATGSAVLSSPSVAGGVVYIGSLDTNLYALDAENGTEKWRFATQGPIRSTPAVVGGVVYVYSRDGLVYALDSSAGRQIWQSRIAQTNQTKSFDDYEYFDSSPTVAGKVLYIGSGDKNLYALDTHDGKAIWTFAANSKISSPPAVADGTVYFGVTDGNFYAVDAATGTNLWKFKTQGNSNNGYPKGDVLHAPVVLNKVVYFGSRDSAVYALDAAAGKKLWRCPIMGGNNWAADSPAIANGLVLIGSSITGALTAIDALTGKQKWVRDTYSQLALYSSPVVADGVVYFGTGQVQTTLTAPALPKVAAGYVQAVDLSSGKNRWKLRLNGHVWSSPAIVNGILYVGCLDGCVYALHNQ